MAGFSDFGGSGHKKGSDVCSLLHSGMKQFEEATFVRTTDNLCAFQLAECNSLLFLLSLEPPTGYGAIQKRCNQSMKRSHSRFTLNEPRHNGVFFFPQSYFCHNVPQWSCGVACGFPMAVKSKELNLHTRSLILPKYYWRKFK